RPSGLFDQAGNAQLLRRSFGVVPQPHAPATWAKQYVNSPRPGIRSTPHAWSGQRCGPARGFGGNSCSGTRSRNLRLPVGLAKPRSSSGHGSAIRRSNVMSQRAGTAESEIKALIEAWADAVPRHDLPAILAHHDNDIVMFDVPPPLQSRGLAEYKKTWDLFFAYHQP